MLKMLNNSVIIAVKLWVFYIKAKRVNSAEKQT